MPFKNPIMNIYFDTGRPTQGRPIRLSLIYENKDGEVIEGSIEDLRDHYFLEDLLFKVNDFGHKWNFEKVKKI